MKTERVGVLGRCGGQRELRCVASNGDVVRMLHCARDDVHATAYIEALNVNWHVRGHQSWSADRWVTVS